MRNIAFILLIVMFSCQKQEYVEVIYSVEHSGNDTLKFKFDSQTNYKELYNSIFDTVQILPVRKYQYKIHLDHFNKLNNHSEIKAYIIIDGTIKDSLIEKFDSCRGITKTLTYRE